MHDRRLIAGERERVKDGITTTKKALEVSVRNAINLRGQSRRSGLAVWLSQQMRACRRSLGRTRVSKRKHRRNALLSYSVASHVIKCVISEDGWIAWAGLTILAPETYSKTRHLTSLFELTDLYEVAELELAELY